MLSRRRFFGAALAAIAAVPAMLKGQSKPGPMMKGIGGAKPIYRFTAPLRAETTAVLRGWDVASGDDLNFFVPIPVDAQIVKKFDALEDGRPILMPNAFGFTKNPPGLFPLPDDYSPDKMYMAALDNGCWRLVESTRC
jgi:hypothetical protein